MATPNEKINLNMYKDDRCLSLLSCPNLRPQYLTRDKLLELKEHVD